MKQLIQAGIRRKKVKAGVYHAVVPAVKDSVTFRIRGYRDADGVEGVRNATYVLNREGTYDARIKAEGGKAVISVELGLLDRAGVSSRLTFAKGSEQSRRIAAAVRTWWDGEKTYLEAQSAKAMGRKPLPGTDITWNSLIESLLRQRQTEQDTLVHTVCDLAYLSLALKSRHMDVWTLTECVGELRPTSPVWLLSPAAMTPCVRQTSWPETQREEYLQSAIHLHPDRAVRLSVVCTEFVRAFRADENAVAAKYYDMLTGEFADTPESKQIVKDFPRPDPNSHEK